MRTDQEKYLKGLMTNALSMVKNATAYIESIQIDEASMKGLTPEQLKDIQKQTELIKSNTKVAEAELDKLTKK